MAKGDPVFMAGIVRFKAEGLSTSRPAPAGGLGR